MMIKNKILMAIILSSAITSFYVLTPMVSNNTKKVIYLHEQEPVRSAGQTILNQYIQQNHNVIVIFYEDWCPPCNRMSPIIEELAQEMSGVITFIKLKREFYRNIFDGYKLSTVPAILFFRNGTLITIQPSSMSKKGIKKQIKKIYQA